MGLFTIGFRIEICSKLIILISCVFLIQDPFDDGNVHRKATSKKSPLNDWFTAHSDGAQPTRQGDLEVLSTAADEPIVYEQSFRGNRILHFGGHKYIRNNLHGTKIYWKCTKWHTDCRARAITNTTDPESCALRNEHNHAA